MFKDIWSYGLCPKYGHLCLPPTNEKHGRNSQTVKK